MWTAYTFSLGFLVVFRNNQAYNRFLGKLLKRRRFLVLLLFFFFYLGRPWNPLPKNGCGKLDPIKFGDSCDTSVKLQVSNAIFNVCSYLNPSTLLVLLVECCWYSLKRLRILEIALGVLSAWLLLKYPP